MRSTFLIVKKVLIAIQARNGSSRLPGKWNIPINGQTVLERVINQAQSSASFINNGKGDVEASACLVVPTGDPIVKKHGHHITVFQGSETDVLSRYYDACERMGCDFIVRITSDCPMLPAFVITKHILTATKYDFDYVTNTREEIRTCPDGHDVEVISSNLMRWAHETATSDYDREHVTTVIKSQFPSWARDANIISYTDESHLKISIDTPEDLEFITTYDQIIDKKIRIAKQMSAGFFRI